MNRKSSQKLYKTAHTLQQTTNSQPNVSKESHFLTKSKSLQKMPNSWQHHFASNTEVFYCAPSKAFTKKAYIPPHLNASQVFNSMNSECETWSVRRSSSQKKLNYDQLYQHNQRRYQKARPDFNVPWDTYSKIANMIQDDKIRCQAKKPYKLYMGSEDSECSVESDISASSQQSSQSSINSSQKSICSKAGSKLSKKSSNRSNNPYQTIQYQNLVRS